MQSRILEPSEINFKDRLTVEHYISKDFQLIKQVSKSIYPVVKLGKIAAIKGGKRLPRKTRYSPTGIPYVRVVDIGESEVYLSNVVYIYYQVHDKIKQYQLMYNYLALVIVGATIGKAAIFKSSVHPCNFNENISRITVKDKNLNPEYILAYLKSGFGQAYIRWLTGGAAQAKLSIERIAKIEVPLPSSLIQDEISKIMQDAYAVWQQKLEKAEQLVENIETYILEILGIHYDFPKDEHRFMIQRSQLYRADVRYFLPFYAQLEQIMHDGIYPTRAIGTICEKLSNGLTPPQVGYTEKGCLVIKVASLTKRWYIDWKKVAFTSEEFLKQAQKYHIKDGDIVMLSSSHQLNYIGRSFAIVRDIPKNYIGQCMAVGELIIIRVNHQIVIPEYLLACFIMKPIQELINRMSRGQTAHLYAEDLQHLRLPIPPIEIQQAIVDELEKRRTEGSLLQVEADQLLIHAKARVERMILGEEDVT